MATDIKEILAAMPASQQAKIKKRAAELVAEEMTLRELRKARAKTQVEMAKALGVTQDRISRLEASSDMLLSTLRKHVEGLGGHLTIRADFPGHRIVTLSGIGENASTIRQASPHRASGQIRHRKVK